MTEPQYIITEARLCRLAKLAYSRKTGDEVAKIVGDTRSSPYTSAEKVLEELDEFRIKLWQKNTIDFRKSWYEEENFIRKLRQPRQEREGS